MSIPNHNSVHATDTIKLIHARLIAFVLSLILFGCGGGGGGGGSPAPAPAPVPVPVPTPSPTQPHALGLITLPTDAYLAIPQLISPSSGTLPATADMSPSLPTPGQQGSQGSCTAWAVAYAAKSYQEAVDHNWNVNAHPFSPSFIYNQINGGRNTGTSFQDALNLVVNQGSALLEDMPYSATDWTTQPSDVIRARARLHAAKKWWRLGKGDIKAELAGNNPVMIAVEVHPDFDSLGKANRIYDNYEGTSRGNHAITLIGYDDSVQAYKFINSWGTDWGIDGYGYIAYKIVDDNVREVYVMEDLRETAALASISVSTLPNKTAYTVGDLFTSAGMAITAYYSDGSNKIVNGWSTSSPNMSQAGPQAVTVTNIEAGVTKTTSFNITVAQQLAKLSSISIASKPTKTAYVLGESFSTGGMVVNATFSDGSSRSVGGWTTSLPNMGSAGTQIVTVTYSEGGINKTASFNITVTAQIATLSSITIASLPAKTTYKVGDTFSTAGMVVTASYSDAASHSVVGWYTSVPHMGSPGTQSVTVTFSENGVTRTAFFDIGITQTVSLSSVAITTLPIRTNYVVGEAFSTAGMVVTASFSDGSSRSVGDWSTSLPNTGSAGTQSVTVTYGENGVTKTASFNITIVNAAPRLATISVSADKAEDVAMGEHGIAFTLRTYDQSNNPMDLASPSVTFSPLGQVQVQRKGVGSYSYTLKSAIPTIVDNASFTNAGVQSNPVSYKFFKWAIQQSLPFTSGSASPANIMRINNIYLNFLWTPTILVEKNDGAAFLKGGRLSLYQGTYPSGIEQTNRNISDSSTRSVELNFAQPGTYYVTSGSMYVGMFTIIKKYQ
jgi:hypothetical protein